MLRSLDAGDADRVSELTLRRFRAGELDAAQRASIEAQLEASASLRDRLRALEDEQAAFERAIPFERFAGGVERARRHAGSRAPVFRRSMLMGALGALAAAAGVLLVVRPSDDATWSNRRKGGDVEVIVRIGGTSSAQREARADALERLAPGERLRIGLRAAEKQRLVAASIDDAGEVTAIYPTEGGALEVGGGSEPMYLPDSVELFGHGRERLVVVTGAAVVGDVLAAMRDAYGQAHGDLAALALTPRAGWNVTSFLFEKP